MDQSLTAAIVTSIVSSGSTAGVAIVALIINNKRFDSVERKMEKIDTSLEMLNGTTKELDKRLSIIEDRILNRN